MLLAIDVGNTNTVFALFKDEDIKHSWRCKTETSRSADEYAVFLNQLFELVGVTWDHINDVIVSSVVPDTNFHLDHLCEKYIHVDPLFIDSKVISGITIDLDQPSEIGADRLVNAVACVAHYDLPAVVIDFGTATTFDIIDKGGIYRGGVIAPGVRLSIEALSSRAAKLPQINIEKPDKVIGKSTLSAMQSGMYWGYVGVVENIIERIAVELDAKPFVIATGGLAPLYAQSAECINEVDDNLIFKGLLEIYKKNKSK
tara:strand:- start:1417 stop:2187 length:771 start_codon:yes stop_codon:yes gene_type:complete